MPLQTPIRQFAPADLDCADFAQLEPLYQALLDRPINSPADLEQWLLDFSELTKAVSEFGTRRNIDYSRHTDDPDMERAYLQFIEHVAPKIKPFAFKLQKKYLDCGFADQLEDPKYKVLSRAWRVDVELFRDENVPLQTQAAKAAKDYDKLCGEMLVEFDGKAQTLQQMARYFEQPDRLIRQQAWELVEKRRYQDAEAMQTLFDQLLGLRQHMAKNAGFDDYIGYAFDAKHRFDYTPDDCSAFADAIEATCMPLVRRFNDQRREALGVDRLRPWDLAVDPKNRAALSPFPSDDVSKMVAGCRTIFERLSPALAADFSRLQFGRNLDLDSRKGKRPGGYQADLCETKEPFIFMNAAGLHRDVETLLHEAGHAFHYMWSCDEPVYFVQHAPIEFCEVASMTMELLADPHMDVFYPGADADRAVRKHLEGIIRFFPWMATIDQFQHWLYMHPDCSVAQRTEAWLNILARFSDQRIDWAGCESFRETMWQRQIHLYHYPFYYVEYGIAQLGALQLWLQSRDSVETALANYRHALKLGGARPLPQLFEAAKIRFDFSESTMRPLIEAVQNELGRSCEPSHKTR